MSELRLTVDHWRLNYTGPFDAKDLYKNILNFWKEKGFDIWPQKEFEQDTKSGKHIEWLLKPWKQITHESRHLVKINVQIYNYKKIDAVMDKKKIKVGNGKVIIYLDGYLEIDQWNVWERVPFFQFLRSIYTNFIYRIYTERFEQKLVQDMQQLYDSLEKFFNMNKKFKIVSKPAPFGG